jgi:Protein of unknown function (DUF3108)
MSTFFPARRRRALVLGSVTILLHWTVLGWLNGQLGRDPRHEVAGPADLYARLVPPEPTRESVPPAPRPLPVPERALPLPAPPPPPPVEPMADAETVGQHEQLPAQAPDRSVPGGTGEAGATIAAPAVESVAGAGPAPAAQAPPAAAPARGFQTKLPPSADLTFDVDRVDADGTRWTGEAALGWKLGQGAYRVKVEVGIRLLFTRVNLLVVTSEGETGEAGFAPALMNEKRRGRAMTATHFNRQDGTITFSASQNRYPLAAGAQDKASVPLQLAAIARADPTQLSGDIDIQVGEDRDASVFHFVLVGQEDIDTRLGRLHAWHLSRPPKPGSYNSRLDVWLAPERSWYPVRIRNTEASGAVTTQTVNNIQMTDTGS